MIWKVELRRGVSETLPLMPATRLGVLVGVPAVPLLIWLPVISPCKGNRRYSRYLGPCHPWGKCKPFSFVLASFLPRPGVVGA